MSNVYIYTHMYMGARSMKSVKFNRDSLAVRTNLCTKWKCSWYILLLTFTDKDITVKCNLCVEGTSPNTLNSTHIWQSKPH